MKLERYKDKKETRKKVILTSLTVVTLVSITMVLYKTFAKFRTSTSFSIMSGQVKYKKKEIELGTDIPTTSTGDGLYSVSHTSPSGWEKAELRYAGSNPNNYVTFNDELWRIIGLVNVQTSSGAIEQRLKIIRNGSIGNFKWSSNSSNNWTQATLMEMLNDGYYNSKSSVKCYNDGSGTCDFSSNNPKGLNSIAQNMIETTISWNIAILRGSNAEENYAAERSSEVPDGAPNVWNSTNSKRLSDGGSTFKGVGLMYASDYAYAVGGSVRTSCLKKSNSEYYEGGCDTNDWLDSKGTVEWTISPVCCTGSVVEVLGLNGDIRYTSVAFTDGMVRPTVYLKKDIKIIDGDGSTSQPFKLSLQM